jgi:hypothetical protein
VQVRGIRLGEVGSVLLDAEAPRILGFDVLCGDGFNRFLPFSTARANGRALELDSTLTLLDRRELDFYRRNARALARVPELVDAVVGSDGALVVPLPARC